MEIALVTKIYRDASRFYFEIYRRIEEKNWRRNQRAATFNFKVVIVVIMPRGHCVISAFYPVERKTHFMDDINGNGLSEGSKRGSIVHRLYRYSPIFFRSPSSTHEKPYFNFSFTRDNGQDLYIKNGE